ncbi:MAG: MarR family transcriptional regulator [Salibacteraceae bacterium]
MKPDETVDYHIRCAWLKISKMYNQQASAFGLTQTTAHVLLNIDPAKGTPSTRLGPQMGMEPTSLSRTLQNMEAKGWIERVPDQSDRRVSRIVLTHEGMRLRSMARESVIDFNKKLISAIPKEKLNHFLDVIKIIDQHTVKQ